MKKLIIASILSQVLTICVFAQTNDNYVKHEFFIGYSFGNSPYSTKWIEIGVPPRAYPFAAWGTNNNGFNASAVYNVSRYFGVKTDVSGTYSPDTYSNTKNLLYNFLGGVQVKDNTSEGRIKPFVHALIGVGHRKMKMRTSTSAIPETSRRIYTDVNDTGLAYVIGGGLDIRIYKRIAVRAFQFDYNPVRIENHDVHPDLGLHKWTRIRFSTGIVF